MRRQFNNFVSVGHSLLRFGFLKILFREKIKVGMIERFSPNVVFEANRGAMIKIGKKVSVHSGSKIKIRRNGCLTIGNEVKMNYNCIIVCYDSIEIGDGTEFGPSVYLYDHDHDYKAGLKEGKFISKPISIGKNCWIGANTIILRGTKIGDNSVVAAGSVLNGEYPQDSFIVQKRDTTVKSINRGQ